MSDSTLRLIDLRDGETTQTTFGTCELCLYTSSHTPKFLVFELNGETREYETGFWDWGDYIVHLDIDNVAAFAEFINTKKINYFPYEYKLQSLVHEYNCEKDD